eukprot:TRINITY_DN1165_c0_g1_i3.p1 TRINITY_DN1165_c0_g1~~TRINITY_DN1165_c0_g1_i3.p1  ORF type:complete len:221 (-),score=31.59 TRINITY_DN1165_c0_g1_i3:124-786(-)
MVNIVLDYSYQHPFELLVMTYNSRFPTHKRIPVLLENIIKSVSYDHVKKELTVVRRVKVDLEAPYWLKRLFGIYFFYIMQTLVYNVDERWMNTASQSLSFRNWVSVLEEVSWREHKDNKDWTYFHETASLELQAHFMGSEKIIEKFIGKSYSNNFENARKLDADFIQEALSKPLQNIIESCEEMIRRSLTLQKSEQYLEMVDFSKSFNFEVKFDKPLEEV